MMKFADVHSHFVYGVDDGAKTQEEMKAMLDAAWQDDVTTLVATPHRTPGVHPFDEALFKRRLAEARDYCQIRSYAMNLWAGAEILYTPALEQYMTCHPLPTLGSTRNVLIEFSPAISYSEIAAAVELLERNGYVPVLAHVERYKALTFSRLYRLKRQSDVLCQVNCSTVLDGMGPLQNLRLHKWFRDEMIDIVASDSHNCQTRKTRMKSAYSTLSHRFGEEYADRLVRFF